jgi:hypothetical protein
VDPDQGRGAIVAPQGRQAGGRGRFAEYAEANPLPQPGEVGRGRNRDGHPISKYQNDADYLARRITRDRPGRPPISPQDQRSHRGLDLF